jgi:hypothetical protein
VAITTVLDCKEGDTECTSTKIEYENALHASALLVLLVQSVCNSTGRHAGNNTSILVAWRCALLKYAGTVGESSSLQQENDVIHYAYLSEGYNV